MDERASYRQRPQAYSNFTHIYVELSQELFILNIYKLKSNLLTTKLHEENLKLDPEEETEELVCEQTIWGQH